MPHNPEAGSASQEKAIEEAIDPPFYRRMMAAFFRSKEKDKINKFYKKPKLKKKNNKKNQKTFFKSKVF